MASKFSARASISAFLIAGATIGMASVWPSEPTLDLKPEGIKIAHTVADTIYFSNPLPDMRVKRSSVAETVYQGADFALSPSGVAISPFRPGVRLYFPLGARFRVSTDLAPYLSWADGSAGPDVPTAPSRWVLISFRNGQPPVLLSFDTPQQWVVSGESGRWSIDPVGGFKGWIRFTAPLGTLPIGSTVGALGEAVKKIRPFADFLSLGEPTFKEFRTRAEGDSVVAIWEFDRPGAMLPAPLMLTKPGGYATQVLTQATAELANQFHGPVAFSRENRIAVRFPVRNIPPGRPICVGEAQSTVSSASGFDIPTVYELAMAMLCTTPDSVTQDAATSALDEYRRSLVLSTAPDFGPIVQPDVMASQALLFYANSIASPGLKNDLLDRLAASLDLVTWVIPADSAALTMRATSLFAIAGAFSGDSELRLRAAMAHAGAVAASMQTEYRKRRGIPEADGSIVPRPIIGLRTSLFSSGPAVRPNPFITALLSPVRLLSPFELTVERSDSGYLLSWIQQQGTTARFTLASSQPLELEAHQNVARIVPTQLDNRVSIEVVPERSGRCSVLLRLPAGPVIPHFPQFPRYSE